jgi:hypothetical protein
MAIFTFLAKLGLDTTDFQTGIKRAQSSASGLGKGISESLKRENDSIKGALAGMFTVSAAKSYFGDLKNIVDEIKDMSELLGVSTDEVQRLQKASAEAGQNFGSVVTAFQRIEQMRAQAMTGDKRAVGIFALLGIDPSKGSGIEILKAAIDASSRGAQENAAAFELVGKKVTGLKLTMEELQRLGPIKLIDQEQLDAIDSAIKKQEEAIRQMKIAGAPLMATLAQGATGVLNMFTGQNRERQNEIGGMYSRGEIDFRKRLELESMSLLGMRSEEGRKYSALPLPGNRANPMPQDQNALILEAARANIKTFEILAKNVDQ